MAYTLVVHLYAKDDADTIKKLSDKLQEASQVYTNDRETLGWYLNCTPLKSQDSRISEILSRFVMQSESDPRAFTIVRRQEQVIHHVNVEERLTHSKLSRLSAMLMNRAKRYAPS